jgi:hypothetical protein
MAIKISTEYKRAGQPRPYADSYYEFIMTFEDAVGKEEARLFAKAIHGCRRFSDEGTFESDADKYFSPHLKKIIPLGDPIEDEFESEKYHEWQVLIVENYTD